MLSLIISLLSWISCLDLKFTRQLSTELEAYPMLTYFNNTNKTGSSETTKLFYSPLYSINSVEELLSFCNTSHAFSQKGFAVLLNGSLFNSSNVQTLANCDMTDVILVHDIPNDSSLSNDTTLYTKYSPDSKLEEPGDFHYPSPHIWNPSGDGLFQSFITKPIMYLSADSALNCTRAARYNHDKQFKRNAPLYTFRASYKFSSDRDSFECINRGLPF